MSLTHRSLLSCPYCVDTQNPLLSSRLMKGSSGYLARYFFRKPPSKSARTPSMSTRTRSLLPEVEEDDMFRQILLNGWRSKGFALPSRRVVVPDSNITECWLSGCSSTSNQLLSTANGECKQWMKSAWESKGFPNNAAVQPSRFSTWYLLCYSFCRLFFVGVNC